METCLIEGKTCSKCKVVKPKTEFSKNRDNKDGLSYWCKSCMKEYDKCRRTPERKEANKLNQRRYRENPRHKERIKRYKKLYNNTSIGKEIIRRTKLKYRYGITIEEYNKLLAEQDGTCAICGTNTPSGPGRFHVDHDHNTGKIRGLLCNRCNPKLGVIEDIQFLKIAIRYLSGRNDG
jgi:hypothetical protein